MIFASDILRLPQGPVKPVEYLVVVAMWDRQNILRAFLGQNLLKRKIWVSAAIHARLKPPFVVLEER